MTPEDAAWVEGQLQDLERKLEQRDDRLRDFRDAMELRLLPVDNLPNAAPLGALLRKRGGDPALYLGNGPGQPLTKLVPAPL